MKIEFYSLITKILSIYINTLDSILFDFIFPIVQIEENFLLHFLRFPINWNLCCINQITASFSGYIYVFLCFFFFFCFNFLHTWVFFSGCRFFTIIYPNIYIYIYTCSELFLFVYLYLYLVGVSYQDSFE